MYHVRLVLKNQKHKKSKTMNKSDECRFFYPLNCVKIIKEVKYYGLDE